MAEAGEGEQDDVSFLRTVKIIYIFHIKNEFYTGFVN
jgi:hypothetical protein